jgi:hypothetical protein
VVESATTFSSAGKLALPLNEAPSQYLTKTRFQLKKSGLTKTGVIGVSFKFEISGLKESQRDKELEFTSTRDSRVPVFHEPTFNRPSDLDSNISHKNQEIFSQLRKIKASLTLLQQVTEDFKEGKTKQRAKDQETKR